MNIFRAGLVSAVLFLPQGLFAESPSERLEELRNAGASMCTSGRAVAMTVGRDRWDKGNEGLAPLRQRLPKPITFLNVYPIDGKPLSEAGLAHIAAAPAIRMVRFHDDSIAGSGFRHFVESANENVHRPRWLVLSRVSLSNDSIHWLGQYKGLAHLQFRSCNVSEEDLAILKQSLPDCEITCRPSLGDST